MRGLAVRELPPHVFSVAELAYRGLERKRESQAVIVSGESGSGKTHSMGRVLDYLVQRAASGEGSNTRASERAIGRLLLDSNPALEAFVLLSPPASGHVSSEVLHQWQWR